MVETIYAIRDEKVGTFMQPFMCVNDGVMRRSLIDALRGSGNLIEKYSSDFKVYVLCQIDTSTGKIAAESVPELVESVENILKVS